MAAKKKVWLAPIGAGSDAEENGYRLDLLLSWLESMRDSELEKAEEKPEYQERAEQFSDLVDALSDLSDPTRQKIIVYTPEEADLVKEALEHHKAFWERTVKEGGWDGVMAKGKKSVPMLTRLINRHGK